MRPKDFRPPEIDELTAQDVLDQHMLIHYTLGRCLAIEEVFRAFLSALPPSKRDELKRRFDHRPMTEMEILSAHEGPFESVEEAQRYVMRAGLAHSLTVMGFPF